MDDMFGSGPHPSTVYQCQPYLRRYIARIESPPKPQCYDCSCSKYSILLFILVRVYFFNSFSNSAAIASPTSLVLDLPPMSAVRTPLSMVIFVASSIFSASSGRHSEYLNIMLMDRTVAMGLTMPLPAISGAEPAHH
jgi:hypothetical protein